MIETSFENLHAELQAGREAFKPALSVRKRILDSYSNSAFADSENGKQIENHAHEYISLMLPRLVANNPRVKVKSRMGGPAIMWASALEQGLNRWVSDTKHARALERIGVDYLTGWAVTLTTLQHVAGFTDQEDHVTAPVVVALDPEQVVWDPAALTWETRRWTAHCYALDADVAKKMEGWDQDMISACCEDVDAAALRSDLGRNVPARKQVLVWEMWVPGDDGEAQIFTLGKMGFLRPAFEFYGPADGPYTLWGAYTVPRRPIPVSPLMMTWEDVEEMNRHAAAISRSAARRKGIVIGDALKPADVDKINNAKDGDVVLIDGFRKETMVDLQLAALTKETMDGYGVVRQRLERKSGLDDALRGNVQGGATATEVAVASEATTIRIAGLSEKFRACDEEQLSKVAWYMHAERSVVIPLGPMGEGTAVYRGGAEEGDKFDFYEFEIERFSMERTSEATQQRRGEMLVKLLEMAPMFPAAAPVLDLRAWADAVGDYLNLPELGTLLNPDGAAQMLNAQMEQAQFAGDQSPAVRKMETQGPASRAAGGPPKAKGPKAMVA